MGTFGSVIRGALAGLNQTAGNPQTAADLEAANQRVRDQKKAQLRAQVLPHGIAIKGLQERIAALDPSDPHYNDMKSALTQDIARNVSEINSILYPDKDSKGNFFERGITDKLHMTSLKSRQDVLKQKRAKEQGQAQDSARGLAEGTVPYTQDPKFLQAQALEKQRAADAQALANVKQEAKPPKGFKAMEQGGVAFGVEDQDTGKQYLRSQLGPDGDAPPAAKEMYATILKAQADKQAEVARKEQLKDTEDEKKRQEADTEFDRRERIREAAQERVNDIREQIKERQQQLAETSKIPAAIAGRVTQAQIIKEQTDTLRTMLKDPDIQQYMGPVAGRTTGRLASLYSKKVRDFYAAQESLDALLPLLHGYRGGAQTHELFKNAMGSLTIDPKAYLGTLDALDKLSDNVVDEVKDEYPNAPMFRNSSQPKSQGGVVSVADAMKKYPKSSKDEVRQAIINQGLTPVD